LKFGSVYFTTNILAATDQLELQSNIWSRDMTQFEYKGLFVMQSACCL